MNWKTLKLRRLVAVVAVLSALAILCAGWGWEYADGGGAPDSDTAALVE